MEATLEEQLIARVRSLSPARQQQILTQLQQEVSGKARTPPGVPGTAWKQFDGLWTPEEADQMLKASEECRQVDLSDRQHRTSL